MIEPMPTLPVILDVDTGVDDACALLLAALHPALDPVSYTHLDVYKRQAQQGVPSWHPQPESADGPQ